MRTHRRLHDSTATRCHIFCTVRRLKRDRDSTADKWQINRLISNLNPNSNFKPTLFIKAVNLKLTVSQFSPITRSILSPNPIHSTCIVVVLNSYTSPYTVLLINININR